MANPIENLVNQAKLRLERARSKHGLVDVVVGVFKRFSESDGGSYSAGLTYYMFFSIFPLLIFATAVLGYVTFGNAELQEDIFNSATESFPMLRDAFSPDGFKAIESARQELAITGVILALYSGSGGIVALEHALNRIHRLDEEPNFLVKRIRSLRWLAILGGAALLSVAASAVGDAAGSLLDGAGPVGMGVAWVLGHVLGIVISSVVFATAFRFLPAKDLSWSDVLPGAVAGAVVFEILKMVGSVWLQAGAEGRNATFGAFYTAATLLIVCFLAARITLLAAEVNAVLAERRITRQSAVTQQQEETSE